MTHYDPHALALQPGELLTLERDAAGSGGTARETVILEAAFREDAGPGNLELEDM